ncbi:helix-turn-helix domain-containing protein [Brucella anthropi]|jgi:transcriptional regulator with XRE-family HTH domain|uniref:Helix-turn-helix transcriptional regulator n=1 Tax=Brucella anthropi TaxID=529 RepID=A0A6I0DTE6_BRUAN|nr:MULTISPECIES: helix-turn-helix transcriptional regulator [Brucella/Ochrobactrum group]KAB2768154.1 helix-turn-helix transcriptional regulator [Brucella anthropi]KAB2797350.1 helix-turn-helix transcriptional regulator [Brucella anthropi]MBA8862686.1 transcriptional regulator with XRE-family HTH domain [Brucella anthropi]PQZ63878.1 XRE family transcriptional regulator [Ochrobactrum sp. MYb49]
MRLTAIFSRNLRLCRQEAGLTQERLAEFAGLDRNFIGKLEREENSPTLETVEALAVALQIPPERLIDRDLPARKD